MVCCWAISASSAFAGTFVDKKDGTVIEVENGLIWQKSDKQNMQARGYASAVSYCRDLRLLNRSDWRLPTAEELVSLALPNKRRPAIDLKMFPDAVHLLNHLGNRANAAYWAQETGTGNGKKYWVVSYFDGAQKEQTNKDVPAAVRCVREK